jgi:hypothetical protein
MYSQFDEIGPGTRQAEFVFRPVEYLQFGDRPIRNPPLINTSLKELAEMEWYLSVSARYVKGYDYTKLKYHFCDPDKVTGYPFLVFKLWAKGNQVLKEKLNSGTLIKLLIERDLTPNFSKPPIHMLRLPAHETKTEIKEVLVGLPIILENEFEILQTLNEQRREQLKKIKRRVGNETPGSDFNALSLSA